MRLSETEKAYIAGLMDGEGCIGMSKNSQLNGDRKLRYRLRVTITTTTPELAAWLIEKTGANIQGYDRGNPRHAKAYRINFGEVPGEQLLSEIQDFLIIKKRQAELYLRYRAIQKFSLANRTAHRLQIKSIRTLRDWFFDEFHRLNTRGPKSVTTNTPDVVAFNDAIMKIESELQGDLQRVIGDNAPPTIQ